MRFYFFFILTITVLAFSCKYLYFATLFLQGCYFLGDEVWWGPSWFKPVLWVTSFLLLILISKRELCIDKIGVLLIGLTVLFYVSSLQAVESVEVAEDFTLVFLKLVVGYLIFYSITRKYPASFPELFCWVNFLGCLYIYKSLLIGYIFDGGRVDTGVGQGGGANYVAMLYAMSLPFVFLKMETVKDKKGRLFFQCCFALFVSALAITGSRAGFLAFLLPLMWLFGHMNSARKVKYGIFLLLTGVVLIVVAPTFTDRIESIDNYQEGSAGERLLLWKTGLELAQNNWLIGIGVNNFHLISHRLIPVKSNVTYDGQNVGLHVHNTYIQLWVEAGFFSLLVFLMILMIAWKRYRVVLSSDKKNIHENIIILSLFAGVIAYCVCAFFGSIIYRDIFYWYLGVISGIWSNKGNLNDMRSGC